MVTSRLSFSLEFLDILLRRTMSVARGESHATFFQPENRREVGRAAQPLGSVNFYLFIGLRTSRSSVSADRFLSRRVATFLFPTAFLDQTR